MLFQIVSIHPVSFFFVSINIQYLMPPTKNSHRFIGLWKIEQSKLLFHGIPRPKARFCSLIPSYELDHSNLMSLLRDQISDCFCLYNFCKNISLKQQQFDILGMWTQNLSEFFVNCSQGQAEESQRQQFWSPWPLSESQHLHLRFPIQQNFSKCEELPETGDREQSDINEVGQANNVIKFQQSNNKMEKESKSGQIQLKSQTIQKRLKQLKGSPTQTENIGKHLKSITMAYLQVIIDAKMLDHAQIAAIRHFKTKSGSIEAFRELLQHDQLRKLCLQFYSSKCFVETVLRSSKMLFKNKIIMIKYLKSFQKINELKNWKSFQE